MKGIEGIYIIKKKDSKIIFSYDLFYQGSEEWNLDVFSSIISAFQSFVGELNQKEIKSIDFGNNIIFSAYNAEYDIVVVMKCHKKVKKSKASEIIEKLINQIVHDLKIYGLTPEEINEVRGSIFEKDIKEIIESKGSKIKKVL